ncbi:bifunctional glycosyltransferase family 2/GtrA family protein [Rothia mucilaginosa]|uniref:bifunctional glycosyltransferase family 2/GtrA family protein n=1 Tax=Rothia mucilaginosa TaxID=43675 RepID=UPI0028E4A612|nr:bifunctional glycosyltransferase family 2/GtrA family protein [Rothia mucilaginosa]
MIILIPAYKPDQSLVRLARVLREQDPGAEILVIDDGSGSTYAAIFTELRIDGVTVQTHPANKGKGAALRTGIAWAKANRPGEVIVTADADGQHLPHDIFRVGVRTETAAAEQKSIVLGVRTKPDPNAGEEGTKVPLRSKIGNSATVGFLALATGARLADTQTGLRGFTPQILDWLLQIPGDKYEYEFSMLLRATRADVDLVQVPIVKVYEPGNPTSHFRPLQDSALIYAPLLAFLASSFLTGFLVDAIALFVLVGMGVPLLAAVVGARIISALTNFTVNRMLMHDGGARPSASSSLVRYAVLAVGILAANAALMEALTGLGASLLVAKILTELFLIPISFAVQRRWVFLPTRWQENTREKTQTIAASSGLRAVSYESARMEAAGIRTGVPASQVRP